MSRCHRIVFVSQFALQDFVLQWLAGNLGFSRFRVFVLFVPFRCPLQEITDDDDDATAPVSCFSCFALEILRCDGWGSVSRVFLVLSRGVPLELLLDRTIVHCVTAATDGSHLTMMNEQIPTGTSVFHRSTSLSGI